MSLFDSALYGNYLQDSIFCRRLPFNVAANLRPKMYNNYKNLNVLLNYTWFSIIFLLIYIFNESAPLGRFSHRVTMSVWQKFGTSPVGMSWDGKYMIPTQFQLFAIPSPDQPPLSF